MKTAAYFANLISHAEDSDRIEISVGDMRGLLGQLESCERIAGNLAETLECADRGTSSALREWTDYKRLQELRLAQ